MSGAGEQGGTRTTNLHGKVVLVAGGSGALGRTVVPAFLGMGARVVTAERKPDSGAPIDRLVTMQADVTDEAECRRLVEETIRREGRIDALVNLVGGFASGRIVETDAAVWQRMLTTNLTAAFLLSKTVLPHLTNRRAGRIVHVAARAALDPFPGAAAYIVSKSGLAALIRVLATETIGSGVTVNGVLPATIDTPPNRAAMPDADPSTWVKPESIAHLIGFLVSDESSQINGALIPIG
ncbi:MAG TPA: SDR family NAD(P)-dependent oxidoreductase [Nitrospiraceae bacterium]|nr:SDR family NAD(P)-dependent oxidoreductase [Nitrospiraceae bacterium]